MKTGPWLDGAVRYKQNVSSMHQCKKTYQFKLYVKDDYYDTFKTVSIEISGRVI
jgi:hypothetical protein